MKYVIAFLAFLATFTGVSVALAAGDAAVAEPSLLDLLQPVLTAAKAGQGVLAACLLLVFGVAAARRYGAKRWPWLAGDAGGAALTLVGSFAGALATALAAGTGFSFALAASALGIAFTASGGYSMVKRLLVPALRKLRDKLPGPARWALDAALWVFGKDPVAEATKAGESAVAANPATGAAGIVGEPTDVK